MLQGAGGNIGLVVGNDAVFVVDDQFAPLTPKVLAAIKAITPDPVKFVLNTQGPGSIPPAGPTSPRHATIAGQTRRTVEVALNGISGSLSRELNRMWCRPYATSCAIRPWTRSA